ncbi:MFS transporter [Nocardia xishanensis]
MTTTRPATAPNSTAREPVTDPSRWWVLATVCVSTFMLTLDITVVNVSLPAIQADLSASFGALQWVVDAYALGMAAFLLTSGSLADRMGRRSLFAGGLVVFTAASVACGVAGNPLLLNISRGVQGVGAAILYAVGPAMLAAAFHGKERGTAFGLFGMTTGISVAAGPLVGGALTEIDWRWVFYLNVPTGLLALLVVLAKVPESARRGGRPVDRAGLVLFSSALFLLVYGIIRGPVAGWTAGSTILCFTGCVVLVAAFVLVQHRGRHPMLDLGLFANRTFDALSAATFVLNFAVIPVILFGVLWMQGVLGHSAIETGLRFLPLTGMLLVAGIFGGILSVRVATNRLIGAALILTGIGFLLLNAIGPEDDWTAALLPFLVAGIGMGLFNPPRANASVAIVAPEDSGMGSGVNETFQQVGSALGVAVLGAVAHARIADSLSGQPVPAAAVDAIAAGSIDRLTAEASPAHAAELTSAAHAAFVSGLHAVATIGGLASVIVGAAALVLIRRQDFVQDPAAPEHDDAPAPA